MIRMINGLTHTEMWVADDRVEEYKAVGCYLPPTTEKPTVEETKKVEKVEEPKKTVKKSTKAKK